MIAKCLFVAIAIAVPATAFGDLLATETFSYPDGQPLYGQMGGTGWSAIWTGSGMNIDVGRAVGSFLGNPPLYGSRSFNNPSVEEYLFVSVDITTPNFGIDDSFGVSTGTGVNLTQVAFGKRSGSTYFEVGNGGWSSTGITILPNTTYHLIGAYRLRPTMPDALFLWVNPTSDDYLDVSTGEHSADASHADFVAIHAAYANLFTNLPGAAFDNLVISNSPGGVGLRSTAVPEASTAVLWWVLAVSSLHLRRRGDRTTGGTRIMPSLVGNLSGSR